MVFSSAVPNLLVLQTIRESIGNSMQQVVQTERFYCSPFVRRCVSLSLLSVAFSAECPLSSLVVVTHHILLAMAAL